MDLRTDDFDYDLPPELIAQEPTAVRDASRLLVLDRGSGEIRHHHFSDLASALSPGDLCRQSRQWPRREGAPRLRARAPARQSQRALLLLAQKRACPCGAEHAAVPQSR